MTPRDEMEFMGINFDKGDMGRIQQKRFIKLSRRPIIMTRYSNYSCLRTLCLYDIIHQMLYTLAWNNFVSLRHPTYKRLTLEFLNSHLLINPPACKGTLGTISFKLFNREYEFRHDEIAAFLQFPHEIDLPCEVPMSSEWIIGVGYLWEQLTEETTNDWEVNKASRIHNLTIRYFWKIMAHTTFGRDNTGSVKSKELYFLHCIFSAQRVHSVAFMLAHMRYVSTTTNGGIAIGGLITIIAHALSLDVEFVTLVPIGGSTTLDIQACRS